MKDEVQEFLERFFEEFQDRVEAVVSNQPDRYISKDVLRLLVENLILKYENRISGLNKSLLAKLIPFLSSNGFDPKFEQSVNEKLDALHRIKEERPSAVKLDTLYQETYSGNFPSDYTSHIDTTTNRREFISDDTFSLYPTSDQTDHLSNLNTPEIASNITPLEGKNQDYVKYFVFKDGSVCLMLCDGVTADGSQSGKLARELPILVFRYLERFLPEKPTIFRWKKVLIDALNYAILELDQNGGSSTFLIAYLPYDYQAIYTGWLGDGHILHFNHNLTGFAKLLTPHQDRTGTLTSAITSNGILGDISTQILSSTDGGVLILSSDGYRLTNGRILQHLYQTVLRHENLQEGLRLWSKSACENENLHPQQNDDQSIILMRWTKEVHS